jgi:enterochelin esterase family protein
MYKTFIGIAIFILQSLSAECKDSQLLQWEYTSPILQNTRSLWIYLPTNYSNSNKPYPLLIAFDGQAYVSELIPTPQILDRLILEKKIPPTVGVFVDSIDCRNLELPCYSPFIQFITQELLPWVYQNYNVTKDPHKIIVTGSSYGGLAATYAALIHPEIFGKVLSQSGAFWWAPNGYEGLWLIDEYRKQNKLPVEFYLDVGLKETEDWGNGLNMIEVNRIMRDLLRQKGITVHYVEFDGDHDYEDWAKAFPDALIRLQGDWQKDSPR